MDREAWCAAVHRVAKSQTRLSKWTELNWTPGNLRNPGMELKSPALAAAAAKSLQSCLTLCDPGNGSPPGSPVPGIFQARTVEWVAISFSNAWKWKVKVKSLSRVRLLTTPWTAAYQVPPSMDFPGKSTGVGCHWQADSLSPCHLGSPNNNSRHHVLNSCLRNFSTCFTCINPSISPNNLK